MTSLFKTGIYRYKWFGIEKLSEDEWTYFSKDKMLGKGESLHDCMEKIDAYVKRRYAKYRGREVKIKKKKLEATA